MQRTDSNHAATYIFKSVHDARDETERLDMLHDGITHFMGGRLSYAPLENMRPTRILELGSGSGAWAIQAAQQFPDAHVLAVDMSPMPLRPLPENIGFEQLDLSAPLPFEPRTFDIVHARLVIMHLPNGVNILKQVCNLVKPGGWLLVEDPDDDNMMDGGKPLGPGMSEFVSKWLDLMRARGAHPCIGRDLQDIIRSTQLFSEVNVKKVVIPMSQKSQDPEENKLGLIWLRNAKQVSEDIPARFASCGFTHEVLEKHSRELEDPDRDITTDLYFTWSLRRMD